MEQQQQHTPCSTQRRSTQQQRLGSRHSPLLKLLLLPVLLSPAAANRATPYTDTPIKFAATMSFQACTWDPDTQKCTVYIRLGQFLSKRAGMYGWPGETWGLAGKYVWGCSYEDSKSNCEIQARWNQCEWDATMSNCHVQGVHTHAIMTSHMFLCADAKVTDYIMCSMQRKNDDCDNTFGCRISNATGMDGKPLRCVPWWYAEQMDKRQQSDFQAQYADTSSAIWDACPYAKVVKSYRDTCYDYVNPVLCNEDNVCYWSIAAGVCVPKDWAMATIVWGGDYKAARNGLNIANQCRAIKDAGTCLARMVKIAPAVKYVPPPPKTPVTNLKAIVQNATAEQQASSKALTVTPGPVASKPGASVNTTVSKGAAMRTDTAQVQPNTSTSKVQNSSSQGSMQAMTYQQMMAANANNTRLAAGNASSSNSSALTQKNSAGSPTAGGHHELLTLIATAIGVALAAVVIGLL